MQKTVLYSDEKIEVYMDEKEYVYKCCMSYFNELSHLVFVWIKNKEINKKIRRYIDLHFRFYETRSIFELEVNYNDLIEGLNLMGYNLEKLSKERITYYITPTKVVKSFEFQIEPLNYIEKFIIEQARNLVSVKDMDYIIFNMHEPIEVELIFSDKNYQFYIPEKQIIYENGEVINWNLFTFNPNTKQIPQEIKEEFTFNPSTKKLPQDIIKEFDRVTYGIYDLILYKLTFIYENKDLVKYISENSNFKIQDFPEDLTVICHLYVVEPNYEDKDTENFIYEGFIRLRPTKDIILLPNLDTTENIKKLKQHLENNKPRNIKDLIVRDIVNLYDEYIYDKWYKIHNNELQ